MVMISMKKEYSLIISLFLLFSPKTLSSVQLNKLENMNPFSLSEDKKKEYELYYFWATWCQNCEKKLRFDLPQMKNEKLNVYSINIDKNPKKALFYIKKKKIKLPVLRDSKKEWQKYFDIQAVPYWVLFKVDKNEKKSALAKGISFNIEKIKTLINQNNK